MKDAEIYIEDHPFKGKKINLEEGYNEAREFEIGVIYRVIGTNRLYIQLKEGHDGYFCEVNYPLHEIAKHLYDDRNSY